MDNVTHSLAGLLLAESAVRLRRPEPRPEALGRAGALVAISSMIAANLPDADLLYAGIGGDRLGYMLQHRGYTHTVLGAVAGALLVWLIVLLIWRSRWGQLPARSDVWWLLALFLVSSGSHLVLDWTNSYGVHLFWPIENRWAYGDAVFIVEPWFWIIAVPALVLATTSRVARVLLTLVLAIGLVLAWQVSLVSRGAALALTIGAAVSIALAWRLPPGARVVVAVGGWLGVTLVMFAGSVSARRTIERAVRGADPSAELLDVALTPLPANAVCLTAMSVERAGELYRVETARVSAAPAITVAARCGGRESAGAPLHPSPRRSTAGVQWDGEWSAPSGVLVALARQSCPALAALRFIRVPIWHAAADSSVMLGDLRYGGAGTGFADVRVPVRSPTCQRAVPPWTPPRSDVLDF